MNRFLVNVLLALTWAALAGSFGFASLVTGFLVGALVVGIVDARFGGGYLLWWVRAGLFVEFYLREVLVSNLKVLRAILDPTRDLDPAILALPVGDLDDLEITVLANLLAMTPGTLPVDVREDDDVLYVHAMFVEDVEATRSWLEEDFVLRVRGVMRP